jgi:hypothetical protein
MTKQSPDRALLMFDSSLAAGSTRANVQCEGFAPVMRTQTHSVRTTVMCSKTRPDLQVGC